MKINIMAEKFGYVTQVIGPVVDVIFEKDGEDLPPIYEALRIERDNGEKLIIEVEQHIGEDTVRCVAMDTTDGLRRGMKAWDLGRTLTMPVGKQIKGRLLNVTGDAIDKLGKLDYTDTLSIHREPPEIRRFNDDSGAFADRYQSDRFIGSLFQRRKNRFVRWGRSRENGADHGIDQ